MHVGELKGRVDFGIITIREDEFEAVLDRFPKVDVVEARRRYRIRRLPFADGAAYTIAVVRCAEQGTSDALNTARDLLEDLDPAFLLVVGIAGGVPAYEFTLGDAIVCTRVVDFSVEAVLKDHSREYALGGGPLHPDAVKIAADVRAMVRDGDLAGWNDRTSIGMDRPPVVMEEGRFYGDNDWKKDVRDKLEHHFGGKATRPPLVVTGAIASSDRLIKEAEMLQVWLKIARQIQAVEMESAGVYKAAHGRVPFLAIRGISDVVGFKRHQDWTTYACHSAAAFTRALLLTKPIRPHAPRRDAASAPSLPFAPASSSDNDSQVARLFSELTANCTKARALQIEDLLYEIFRTDIDLFFANSDQYVAPAREAIAVVGGRMLHAGTRDPRLLDLLRRLTNDPDKWVRKKAGGGLRLASALARPRPPEEEAATTIDEFARRHSVAIGPVIAGESSMGTSVFYAEEEDGMGAIFYHASGARVGDVYRVRKGIGWIYLRIIGGIKSKLGLPTSNEESVDGGCIGYFENGYVEWRSKGSIVRAYLGKYPNRSQLILERAL